MSNLSFSRAKSASFQTASLRDLDFANDPKMRYTQVINMRDDKLATVVYSIDPAKILDRLVKDELDDLVKITLGCQTGRAGETIFDVGFNTVRRLGLVASINVTTGDFDALARRRVLSISNFLDLSREISKFQNNIVQTGDRLIVSIFDVRSRKTYILIYLITGFCMAEHQGKAKAAAGDGAMTSAINCTLEHVYKIDEAGQADVIDVRDDSELSEKGQTVVGWALNAVTDPKFAYPWKPHFLPGQAGVFSNDNLEQDLSDEIAAAADVSYDVFESLCRETYDDIRQQRSDDQRSDFQRKPRRDGQGKPKDNSARKEYTLPEIKSVILKDQKSIFVKFLSGANEGAGLLFPIPESGKASIVESYLLGKDFEGKLIAEFSGVYETTVPNFGNATIRYLTLNF